MKKKICLFLAVPLLFGTIGCSQMAGYNGQTIQDTVIQPTADALPEDNKEPEYVLPEAVFTDYDNTVAIRVGGINVSLAEYRHYFLVHKRIFDGTNSSFWVYNEDKKTLLYDNVLNDIKLNAADDALAQVLSVSLSDEQRKSLIDNSISEVIAHYKNAQNASFESVLEENYLTDSLYRKLQEDIALKKVIYDTQYAPGQPMCNVTYEQVLEYIHSNYIRVKHIMLKTVDLDTSERAVVRSQVEKILELAGKGEDFDLLVSQYNQDLMDAESGFYILRGEMPEEFEKAAFGLSIGETSGIVETAYGYHIIRRYPVDEDFVINSESLFGKATDDFCYSAFERVLQSTASSLTTEYSPYFSYYLDLLWQE